MPPVSALEVELGPFRLRTPVLLASGCCGYGPELSRSLVLREIGGFVTKTITLAPRPGNPSDPSCASARTPERPAITGG